MYKTNLIRDLLQADEPLFSLSIQELEAVTGNHLAYKILSINIKQQLEKRLSQLGLESSASEEDIYLALLERIKNDNARLAKILGISDFNSPEEVEKVVYTASDLLYNLISSIALTKKKVWRPANENKLSANRCSSITNPFV